MAYYKEQAINTEDIDISLADHTVAHPSGAESRNSGPILYVGTGGDVKVKTVGGQDATFKNVPNGTWLPVQVIKVYLTGTTAADMIATW